MSPVASTLKAPLMLPKAGMEIFVNPPLSCTKPPMDSSLPKSRSFSAPLFAICSPPYMPVTWDTSMVERLLLEESVRAEPALMELYGMLKLSRLALPLMLSWDPTGHVNHVKLFTPVSIILISWISPPSAPVAITHPSNFGKSYHFKLEKLLNAGKLSLESTGRLLSVKLDMVVRVVEDKEVRLATFSMSMLPVTVVRPERSMVEGPSAATTMLPVKVGQVMREVTSEAVLRVRKPVAGAQSVRVSVDMYCRTLLETPLDDLTFGVSKIRIQFTNSIHTSHQSVNQHPSDRSSSQHHALQTTQHNYILFHRPSDYKRVTIVSVKE